jgi:hypothetical protein
MVGIKLLVHCCHSPRAAKARGRQHKGCWCPGWCCWEVVELWVSGGLALLGLCPGRGLWDLGLSRLCVLAHMEAVCCAMCSCHGVPMLSHTLT